MDCDRSRELVSADLDGELADADRSPLEAHLRTCGACRAFADEARSMQHAMRVAPAPVMPDLAQAMFVRRRRPPAMLPLFLRYALLVLAIIGLCVSVPELWVASASGHVHAARHLSSWSIAFSIGLIVAAIQPARARGMLPMALALGGVMIATAVQDVLGGHTPGMAESMHVLEVIELVLLWLLARLQPEGPGRRPWRRRPVTPSPDGDVTPSLRVVHPMLGAMRAHDRRRRAA